MVSLLTLALPPPPLGKKPSGFQSRGSVIELDSLLLTIYPARDMRVGAKYYAHKNEVGNL